MKYLVVGIHPSDGAVVIIETDDMMEAVRVSNRYNRMNDGCRYTVYEEAVI